MNMIPVFQIDNTIDLLGQSNLKGGVINHQS
jgi:hypothetical protein